MENFQNDCCRPWTKNLFKNSYSKHLRVVNKVVTLITGQIDWPKFIYLQTKAATHQTMSTTLTEVNNDKTKVPVELIFRSVSLVCFTAPNSMSKLIHNRYKCKHIISTTAIQTSNCVCYYALVCYFVVLISTSENYTKTIIRFNPRLRLGEYSPMFTWPLANNCYISLSHAAVFWHLLPQKLPPFTDLPCYFFPVIENFFRKCPGVGSILITSNFLVFNFTSF